MIEFVAENEEIELKHYDPDVTLTELAAQLESFRLTCGLKTSECKGCGECCTDNIPVLGLDIPRLLEGLNMRIEQATQSVFILPERPDIDFRRKAIREMGTTAGITPLEATLLFEYNNAEPIILAKQAQQSNQDGQTEVIKSDAQTGNDEQSDMIGNALPSCCFLHENLCSRYSIRPYSCGLYLCNAGERLSYIQEMVIRQGTWHAYYKLGWIDVEAISHNPFLKAGSYDMLPVADFEFNFENALEQLFFYF